MENQFKYLLDQSSDAFFVVDKVGNILYTNHQGSVLTEYSVENLLKMNISNFLTSKNYERALKNIKQRIEGEKQTKLEEHIIKTKNGIDIPVEIQTSKTTWNNESVVLAILRNIQEKQNNELKIDSQKKEIIEKRNKIIQQGIDYRQSLRRYKLFFDSANDVFVILDSDLNVLDCNNAVYKYLPNGYQKSDLLGKPLAFINPKISEHGIKNMRKALFKGDPITYIQDGITPNQKFHRFRISLIPFNDKIGIIAHDLTEIDKTKEILQFEKEIRKNYLDIAGVIVVGLDTKGNVNLINKYGQNLLGYAEYEIIGKNWFSNFLPNINTNDVQIVFDKLVKGELKTTEFNENSIKTRSGEERIIFWHNAILKNQNKEIIGTLSSGTDITELKKTHTKLLLQKNRLESTLESTHAVVWEWDILENTVIFDKTWLKQIIGEDNKEFLTDPFKLWENLTHPDDLIRSKEIMEKHLADIFPIYECEVRLRDSDGNWRWFLNRGKIIERNEKGEPLKLFAILTDIGDVKKIQEKLEKNKRLLDITEKFSKVGGWEYDVNTEQVYVTEEFLNIFGFQNIPMNILDLESFDFLPESIRVNIEKSLNNAITNAASYNLKFQFTDLNQITKWIKIRGIPIKKDEKVSKVIGTVMDITDQVFSQKILEESEKKFRNIFEKNPLGILMYQLTMDNELILIDTNPAADAILNFDTSKLIGKPIEEAFPGLIETEIPDNYRKVAKFGNNWESNQVDYDYGEIAGAFKVFAFQIYTNSVVVMFDDITEEIRNKERIKENRNHLQTIINSSPNAITVMDINGIISLCNIATAKLHGFDSIEELLTLNALTLVADSAREHAEKMLKDTLELGMTANYQFELKRKDGSTFPAEISASLLRNNLGEPLGFIGVATDISNRIEAEKERIKHQKYEALSYLASGIAHDFNNALMLIGGNLSLLKTESFSSVGKELIEIMENAIKNAKKSTNYLIRYGKLEEPAIKVQNLNSLIATAVNFVSKGSSCKITLDLSKNMPNVEIDEGLISQVLNNILINAQQAMDSGGEILVKSYFIPENELESIPLFKNLQNPKDFIVVSVKDQGIGIKESDKERIFDPYYSTKKFGSGIGLATSLSIIQKHKGHILFESEYQKGTTFYILLPITYDKEISKSINKIQEIEIHSSKRVLIMEDNENIQKLLEKMMIKLNISCVIVESGQNCINEYRNSMHLDKPFNLLILDNIIVGGMGGKDTLLELKKLDPSIKAIISSGNLVNDYAKYGFLDQIQKPFSLDDLSSLLKRYL